MWQRLKSLLFGTLRRQFILGMVLANVLLMSLLVWDLSQRQRHVLEERQREHAAALAQSIAIASSGWLAARDYSGLREIVAAQSRYPELRFAMILDNDGHVVAHSDPARVGQYVLDLPDSDYSGTADLASIRQQTASLVDALSPVLLAGHRIGWARVGIGQEAINERLAAITRDGVIYTLVAVVLGSLLAVVLGHRLTRRLYLIQQVSDAVQRGDYSQRARLEGYDEAGRLASAFDAMLDTLAGREQALRESETRFRALIETSFLPMLVTGDTPGNPVLMLNRQFTEVFGYTLGEIPAVSAWWPLAFPDPDYRQEVARRWQEAMSRMEAQGGSHIKPVVVDIACKDGGSRYGELHMTIYQGRALILFHDLDRKSTRLNSSH